MASSGQTKRDKQLNTSTPVHQPDPTGVTGIRRKGFEMAKKDLVQLVRDNPNAVFIVDNDCWWMRPAKPKPDKDMTDQDWEIWSETELANDADVIELGDGGYGSGNRFGGDILQALAVIVGVKVESV